MKVAVLPQIVTAIGISGTLLNKENIAEEIANIMKIIIAAAGLFSEYPFKAEAASIRVLCRVAEYQKSKATIAMNKIVNIRFLITLGNISLLYAIKFGRFLCLVFGSFLRKTNGLLKLL